MCCATLSLFLLLIRYKRGEKQVKCSRIIATPLDSEEEKRRDPLTLAYNINILYEPWFSLHVRAKETTVYLCVCVVFFKDRKETLPELRAPFGANGWSPGASTVQGFRTRRYRKNSFGQQLRHTELITCRTTSCVSVGGGVRRTG